MTTATAVGDVEMRIAKVVGLAADDELFDYVVLEEVAGDRQLPIEIGWAEAFSLAARLGGIAWRRPMTYQFVAALVQALGGRVRQVRIDRVVEETYLATVEVEGPPGMQSVDARPSDALNLAVPSWLLRRDDQIGGAVFWPIDHLERRGFPGTVRPPSVRVTGGRLTADRSGAR
jgi:bifunctional DNase/RNase